MQKLTLISYVRVTESSLNEKAATFPLVEASTKTRIIKSIYLGRYEIIIRGHPHRRREGGPSEPMKGDENRYLVLGIADVIFEVPKSFECR